LIDDLSRVAAAEEGSAVLHRRPIQATDLLTSAISAAAPNFNRAVLTLSLEPPDDCVAMVDPDRLQEVLTNLLSNALRHTPQGGKVTLGAVNDGQTVRLSVTDNGEGITAEHLPRVFERFYRVESHHPHQHGGSGIGLAITRALVQAHDGHVQAHSAGPGKGSTFTITLPAS